MKTSIATSAPILAGCLFLTACTGIKYDDPGKVETLTIDYGSTDLQTLSAEMVDSLLASPGVKYLEKPGDGDPRTIIVFGGIENRTSEHIDTEGIADKIQTQLVKSQEFRFLATQRDQGQVEIEEQVRFQQGSGRVRDDQMRAFGKQLGAEVILYGSLRSIEKGRPRSIESAGKKKEDVYYQFTLKCVNIDTAEIIWQEEAELRKTSRTGFFGRS